MASLVASPLRDGHGRLIGDLRVSVTDRCNFRCQYCMPAEGLPWLERAELLTFEEIEHLVRLLVPLGVRSVRLTGGEPLVRRELPKLIAMLSAIDGLEDLSLTTNGYLLERMADELVEAGLERINVSLDSLSRDRFFEITRRDSLPQVVRGLETLERFPQLGPVKVNCVAMRGFTEDEVIPFAELARRKPYQIRFIEFMPLDADRAWTEDRVLSGAEIRAMIDRVYPLEPVAREAHATAKVWRFVDGRGEIGFRLTAEGKLRTCLFSLHETDLRGLLRDDAGDERLVEAIRDAVWRKELKHHVLEPGFRQPPRTMSQIGG